MLADRKLCQMCGNDIDQAISICPYCKSKQTERQAASVRPKPFRHKVVNLEEGRPFLDTALRRLAVAIQEAKSQNIQVLIVIHGYGSSGKGGVIRLECRKVFEQMYSRGQLEGYLFGEDLHSRGGFAKTVLRRFPQIGKIRSLKRSNPGITVIVL